jgi:hypothetical protein
MISGQSVRNYRLAGGGTRPMGGRTQRCSGSIYRVGKENLLDTSMAYASREVLPPQEE